MQELSTSASFPPFHYRKELSKIATTNGKNSAKRLILVSYISKSSVHCFKALPPNHRALIPNSEFHSSDQICHIGVLLNVAQCILGHFEGILNRECAVFPPGINVAAIPEDATAIATSPSPLTLERIKLVRNVFPVPPGASIKIIEGRFLSKQLHTWSYTALCSAFSRGSFSSTNCCCSGLLYCNSCSNCGLPPSRFILPFLGCGKSKVFQCFVVILKLVLNIQQSLIMMSLINHDIWITDCSPFSLKVIFRH